MTELTSSAWEVTLLPRFMHHVSQRIYCSLCSGTFFSGTTIVRNERNKLIPLEVCDGETQTVDTGGLRDTHLGNHNCGRPTERPAVFRVILTGARLAFNSEDKSRKCMLEAIWTEISISTQQFLLPL